MRLKIDENLHADVAELLRTHGHDAQTVWTRDCKAVPTQRSRRRPYAKDEWW